MKNSLKTVLTPILLTLIISVSAVAPVFAQTSLTEQAIIDSKTSFSQLYEEINPSVVYIAVSVPADQSSSYQRMDDSMPFDLDEIFPYLEQFNQQQNQQTEPEPDSQPEQQMTFGSGTGFVWDTDGHIVTNNHVIENAVDISVTYSDGIQRKATVIGADPDSDLAVIEVENYKTDSIPVTMGDSSQLKTGDFVAAIGNPFGNTGTITSGIISALGRSFALENGSNETGHYTIPDMIQTDAAINPGNSGGVLINLNGEVIGIVNSFASSTYSSAGIGYAIPSNLAQRVVPKLISDGKYEHAWIGVSGIALTPDINQVLELDEDMRGALVQSVQPNSPAEASKLAGGKETASINGSEFYIDGDIITKIDDKEVTGMDDIIAYLASNTSAGDTIVLHIIRDGKEMDQDLTLAARPTTTERTQTAQAEPDVRAQTGDAWIGTYVKDISDDDIQTLDLEEGTTGALISQITKDSPADDAELKVDDIIQKINDVEIANVDELKAELSNYLPGERVTLIILRDSETIEVRLTLGTTKTR